MLFRKFLEFDRLYVRNFYPDPAPPVDPTKDPIKDPGKSGGDDLQALKDEVAALKKEKASWELKDPKSLNDKVKQEREEREKKDSGTKNLESALTFNLTSAAFLKENESILPKEISEIFAAAEKEKYESALEKANATKAAVIQSFFTQQANVDLLTENQKLTLADYLKLTKNAKEEKAKEIYENLFEPALSMLKRIKKAEELGRNKAGFRDGGGDSAYRDKMMNLSKKHFLGESSVIPVR